MASRRLNSKKWRNSDVAFTDEYVTDLISRGVVKVESPIPGTKIITFKDTGDCMVLIWR